MSEAVCLILSSFAVAVLAPRPLARLTHRGIAPQFELVAWLSAIGSVIVSWTVVPVIVIAYVIVDLAEPGRPVLDSCYTQLHDAATGHYGVLVQGGFVALTGFAMCAGVVLLVRVGRWFLLARSTTHEHARMVRIAGRHDAGLDAIVLEVAQPAAYSVAGKPRTVVVTRGAIAALDQHQLRAVLEHERAHLAGRHHLWLALTRGLAANLSRIELFTLGATEVARLLEMCADDAAARVHGRPAVLRALLTLSGIPEAASAVLGMYGVDLPARVERLIPPIEPRPGLRAHLALGVVVALVIIGPLASATLAAIGIAVSAPLLG
ncbi:M56 family metallopeptidase [Nocardia sp. NBC_01009]|uniref:M56 family metallopeptidase n=1 Tax=Nocardia sp. NBC_01009 TaxID=2975996 RepID=UPI0038689817|nr:M56 family metallopeptidase [Nocardia sp. NBC_01009]